MSSETTNEAGIARPTGERRTWLRIYVSDHLAGSAAGARRIERLAAAERDGPDGPALRTLADEIAEDKAALESLADALGLHPQRSKQLAMAIAERVGLLKLNGRVFSRSPLTTLVEVEAMVIAVRGKLAGWQVMSTVPEAAAAGVVDVQAMVDRSQRHLDTLTGIHQRTAARLLA